MKYSLIFLALMTTPTFALETDQFIASKIIIKDSADIFNRYFKQNIEKAIDSANSKNPEKIKCSEVASNVMNNLVGGKYFAVSKISRFAKKSPEVDKFPDDSVTDREYFKMTMYEEASFLLKIAPLARTININGVYMGTDKLGHFALIGRNYYHNYLSNLENGMSKEQALEKAILKGFKTEKGILGYGIGGVLSYGDLEANYEGMKFAIDLCDGENPYIILKNNQYEKNPSKTFTVADYFNPRMDESFHFSFWKPSLYKRVKDKLAKEYCETKDDPMYIERVSKYPRLLENVNDRLVREHLLTIDKFDRKLEDVISLCK